MRRINQGLFISLLIFISTGCTSASSLQKRASLDLGCPEDQLTMTTLASDYTFSKTMGVSGCGKKATYIRKGANGSWEANTPKSDN